MPVFDLNFIKTISMKNAFLIIIILSSVIFSSCKENIHKVLTLDLAVNAPFDMPTIKTPDFKTCKKFNIIDFGAKPGNKPKTTKAIAEAINKASELDGGTVQIPKGEWLTGKIHLKSNVNLHLDEGAVLLFSELPEDYLPAVHTTWEGMECFNYSPLIYAYNCENIAITGKGELKAKMDVWKDFFSRSLSQKNNLKKLYNMASEFIPVEKRQMVNDTAHLRPQFIQFNRCDKVLLEGVSITNSPFWVIHPYMSKNVVIRDVKVQAKNKNNDGVDPEMTQNMLIENCIFDQGDDAIAVKSGRNQEAWEFNTPTKNVVIKNCFVKNGHQLLAIGSELSGGVQNIFMDSCEVSVDAKLNHLLYIKTNERRGGFVNNIHMSNVKCGKIDKGILGIETDVLYQWGDLVPTYEKRLTPISNIILENVHATDVQFISKIQGQEDSNVKNVCLKNVTSENVTDQEIMNENVINFERVTIKELAEK